MNPLSKSIYDSEDKFIYSSPVFDSIYMNPVHVSDKWCSHCFKIMTTVIPYWVNAAETNLTDINLINEINNYTNETTSILKQLMDSDVGVITAAEKIKRYGNVILNCVKLIDSDKMIRWVFQQSNQSDDKIKQVLLDLFETLIKLQERKMEAEVNSDLKDADESHSSITERLTKIMGCIINNKSSISDDSDSDFESMSDFDSDFESEFRAVVYDPAIGYET